MKRIFVLFVGLILSTSVFGQNLPNDCVNAIVVCGNENFSSNASGIGAIQEVSGCGGFEHNSLWIKINIVQSGTLGFDLIPNDTDINVDYDFWVYGANRPCNNLGSPIRCATTNPALAGMTNNHTGMNGTMAITQTGPGANGNGYVRWITVNAGESYYIAVDRPVGDGGFEIQWTGSAMSGTGAFPLPPTANSIPDYITCSSTPNLGIFDLNTKRPLINSDTTNNTITFYTSYANASDGISPLPNVIANTSNPQQIFAKVVNNASGCSSITSFYLRVVPVPFANISISDTQICSGENVTVSFTGSPNTVVEYRVNGGAIQTVLLDASGNFQLTEAINANTTYSLENAKIVDASNTTICNQLESDTVTVTVSTVSAPTISTNSPICQGNDAVLTFNGLANAIINYTVNGGSSQSVTLNGSGQQQVNLSGLPSGANQVVLTSITDTNAPNCTSSLNIVETVNVTAVIVADVTGTAAICENSGAATITFTATNGTAPYSFTYNVNGGASQTITTSSGNSVSVTAPDSPAGTFTYNLTAVSSAALPVCSFIQTASAVITVHALPTVSVSNATVCSGDSATVTATPGAAGTYTYAWTVPTGVTNPGSVASFATTVAGNYSVVITDTATNCVSTSASGTVTHNSLPTVTVNNASICAGASATVTATPGSAGTYTYVWTVPAGVTNPGSVASFSTTVAGNYSVVITNTATNCSSASASGTITNNPLPTVTVNSPSVCAGNAATVTATPGTTTDTHSYAWTVPAGATNPGNVATFTTTVAGTYSVVITNTATSCVSASASGTVTVNPNPTVTVNSPTVCTGASATVTATPGVAGTYTYNWTVPTGVANPGSVASFTITVAGTYSVVISNGTCSSASVSGTVSNYAVPTISGTTTLCQSSTSQLTASGGAPAAVSPWTSSDTTIATVSNTGLVSGIAGGTVTITYTTVNGCTATTSVTVNPTITPTFNFATVYCSGVTSSPLPTTSLEGVTGTWSPAFNSNTTTTYTFTPSAGQCAVSPAPVTIQIIQSPVFTITNVSPALCNGESINVTFSSNVPGTTYTWSATTSNINGSYPSSGDETNINQAVQLIDPMVAGSITFDILPTANGCNGEVKRIEVIVNPIPVITPPTVDDTEICTGEMVTIDVNGTPAGIVYHWQVINATNAQVAGGVTSGTSTTGEIEVVLEATTNTTSGTIQFEITPVRNGCTGQPETTPVITVHPTPGTPIPTTVFEICTGGSTNIRVNVLPLIAGTNIEWEVVNVSNVTGATPGSGPITDPIVQQLTNNSTVVGTVTYRVKTELNGCYSGTTDYIVEVHPLPNVTLPERSVICIGEDGEAFTSVLLDTGLSEDDYAFDWTLNGTPIVGGSSILVDQVSELGEYSVIVTSTDPNNPSCPSEPVTSIVEGHTVGTISALIPSVAFDENGSITVVMAGGTGGYLYALSPTGPWQESNVFTNLNTGNSYTVYVTDENGCTSDSQSIYLIGYPHFFTPNGDGANDYWNIWDLEEQPTAEIHIFDRYGKLIKQITPAGGGWDGTMNGQLLPSTDYWFTVKFIDPTNNAERVFKAHFSMKR